MNAQLPRRPYGALPPPPDGLARVRHEARRRRRLRATAVAAGGAGVAAIATVVAVSTAGAGFAVLQPDRPAGGGLTTRPAPSAAAVPGIVHHAPRPSTRQARGQQVQAGSSTQSHKGSAPGAAGGQRALTTPSGFNADTASRSSDRITTPELVRYRSTAPAATVRAARLCGESASYGQGAHASVGWCFNATAKHVADGVRLTLQLCRDNTGAGQLDFANVHEVDITVLRAGKTVWDWGRDHPDSPYEHELTAPVNGCWNWSLNWMGNTQSGAAASHGAYTFVATTLADQLSGDSTRSVRFSY